MSGRLNDPELVRAEYADESRFAAGVVIWDRTAGPDPRDIAVEAVRAAAPAPECSRSAAGRGELAARIEGRARRRGRGDRPVRTDGRADAGARRPGAGRRRAGPPFDTGSFDCAVAAWMLYHVDDLDHGLVELARVLCAGGRLVAITNTELNIPEVWGRFGERAGRVHGFNTANGEELRCRHFATVERYEARGTVTLPDYETARRYISSSIRRRELVDELEPFDGPLVCSRHSVVFVAETAA